VSSYHVNGRGYGSHQAIIELVTPNSNVLDVGCASGYLMTQLEQSKECRCTGIEPHLESARLARSSGFTVIDKDAITAFKSLESSERFDQIIFGDVLEHMVDPSAVLSKCRDLLRPTGMVIVSLPNIVGPRGRVPTTFGIWRYQDSGIFDKTHLRFFSVPTGRELLVDAGFRIEREIFVGPLTTLGGRPLRRLTALRPNLLANQMVFSARSPTILN
jgi:methionine biosynthesis protein MetW